MEGGNDGANTGVIYEKDVVVGLGIIGVITGVGGLVEAATAAGAVGVASLVPSIVSIINNLDDALGGFLPARSDLQSECNNNK